VMLSARAGEEAKVEGLHAGADDYLVKPFSARELLARVRTQLDLSALRVHMRARYELLGSIVEQAPVPMCVLAGRELVFELANELYSGLVGARDIVGLPLLSALPELAGQGFDDLLLRVIDTQEAHVAREAHVRLARGEGGEIEDSWWTFVYAPLHGPDGAERVIVVAHDVTDQVRARNLVQASEERFRRVVDQVQAGIAQADLQGRFVLANERYRQITGRSAEELSQLHVSDIVHREDAAFVTEKLGAALERGAPFVVEHRLVRPDGSIVWVQSSVARIDDDFGTPTGIATVTIDITQRKYAEAARVSHLADMERALRFSEMFVGILGHDLRNPLSAISMAASLLSRRAAESPWLARPLGRILTSADRMERMISQLLDFTQIRLGQGLPVRFDWIDLHDVARATVEELEPVYDREIDLHVDGDTHAAADRDRLSQLVSNLVANAAQHGTSGTPVRIRIDGARADRLTLEVQNAGVIGSDVLPTLFEPLRTAGDGARRRGGSSGLGLGLYITHQIALSHGGSITVRSDEDRGTCFVVDLPRRPDERL
jgi:PAS domain S-box-containing protein